MSHLKYFVREDSPRERRYISTIGRIDKFLRSPSQSLVGASLDADTFAGPMEVGMNHLLYVGRCFFRSGPSAVGMNHQLSMGQF